MNYWKTFSSSSSFSLVFCVLRQTMLVYHLKVLTTNEGTFSLPSFLSRACSKRLPSNSKKKTASRSFDDITKTINFIELIKSFLFFFLFCLPRHRLANLRSVQLFFSCSLLFYDCSTRGFII